MKEKQARTPKHYQGTRMYFPRVVLCMPLILSGDGIPIPDLRPQFVSRYKFPSLSGYAYPGMHTCMHILGYSIRLCIAGYLKIFDTCKWQSKIPDRWKRYWRRLWDSDKKSQRDRSKPLSPAPFYFSYNRKYFLRRSLTIPFSLRHFLQLLMLAAL